MANDDPVPAFPGSDLIKLGQNNKKIQRRVDSGWGEFMLHPYTSNLL